MKTESEILTEFYHIIKDSELHKLAGGDVIKSPDTRRLNSPTDDIVIMSLAGNMGQVQEADLNINIFVHDIKDRNGSHPSPRIKILERAALDLLESIVRNNICAKMASQHTYKVLEADQHCINNRIYYKTIN